MAHIQTLKIPPCTKEFALLVQRIFTKIDIKPGVSADEIMFNAGEQKVVDYILKVSHEQIVSGDPDVIRTGSTGALNKALGKR